MTRYTPRVRRLVASTSDGGPSIGLWLDRVRAIDDPTLTTAIEGIWCGYTGAETIDLPGYASMLCVGWYHGRVEYCYLS
jgi:hypothetical protein